MVCPFTATHLSIHMIDFLQRLAVQNLPAATAVDPPLAQEQEPVAKPQGQVEVVDYHNGGDVLVPANIPDNPQNLILILNVQAAGGFIQQQYLGLLGQGPWPTSLSAVPHRTAG